MSELHCRQTHPASCHRTASLWGAASRRAIAGSLLLGLVASGWPGDRAVAQSSSDMSRILNKLSVAEARLRSARLSLVPPLRATAQTASLSGAGTPSADPTPYGYGGTTNRYAPYGAAATAGGGSSMASVNASADYAQLSGMLARLDGTKRKLDRMQQRLAARATTRATGPDADPYSEAAMARLVRDLDAMRGQLTALQGRLRQNPSNAAAGDLAAIQGQIGMIGYWMDNTDGSLTPRSDGRVPVSASLAVPPARPLPKPARTAGAGTASTGNAPAPDIAAIRGQIGMTGLWLDATEAQIADDSRRAGRSRGKSLNDKPRSALVLATPPASGRDTPSPVVVPLRAGPAISPPPRKPVPPGGDEVETRDALLAELAATRYDTVRGLEPSPVVTADEGADPPDAPRALVERLHRVVLDVSRRHAELGFQGRRDRFREVLSDTFHFAKMAEFSVGAYWQRMSAGDKQKAIDGFAELITAMFADRFDFWYEQTFRTVDEAEPKDDYRSVSTQLVLPFLNEKYKFPIRYVAREIEGRWWLVDVLPPPGYSEVWARRAEYLAVLGRIGVNGFLDRMAETVARYDART